MSSLKRNWEYILKDQCAEDLNKIDQELTSLLLLTERKYRKLKARVISYSPALLKVGLKFRF